ncbi:MAG: hypothetical protein KBT28_01665 [Bacteroidales bacterium]|nr:hypothetical protein [Candidatus Colimorpha merdihippi]
MALDFTELTIETLEKQTERDEYVTHHNRVQELLDANPGFQLPADLTDAELWENYCDEELYLLEKKLREYFLAMRSRSKSKNGYRTSCDLVFTWMFGRPPEAKDGALCKKLNRLLNFYAAKVTGATTINGKKIARCYHISKYGTFERRPLSVKLRMELNARKTGSATNARTFVHLASEDPKGITPRRPRVSGTEGVQGRES